MKIANSNLFSQHWKIRFCAEKSPRVLSCTCLGSNKCKLKSQLALGSRGDVLSKLRRSHLNERVAQPSFVLWTDPSSGVWWCCSKFIHQCPSSDRLLIHIIVGRSAGGGWPVGRWKPRCMVAGRRIELKQTDGGDQKTIGQVIHVHVHLCLREVLRMTGVASNLCKSIWGLGPLSPFYALCAPAAAAVAGRVSCNRCCA